MSATKTKPNEAETAIVQELTYADERADAASQALTTPGGLLALPARQPRQPDGVLAKLIQLASDPNVDLDRFERLMLMREKAQADYARRAFDADLADMQRYLPIIEKKGRILDERNQNNIKERGKYAKLEDVVEAIRPILHHFGFGLRYQLEQENGHLTVTAILSHEEGHREETPLTLAPDASGGKNSVQAIGSAEAYGIRYTTIAATGVVARGFDDDGKNAAKDGEPVTDDQLANLHELLIETKADEAKFRQHFKIDNLSDLTQAQFPHAIDLLQRKKTVRK